MRRKQNRKRGFTLVEIIVVLTILAILAAIVIPSMTGWIGRSQEKTLIVACRRCVVAAQALAVEDYAAHRASAGMDGDAVKTLAEVPGTVSDIVIDNANVSKLTYSEDGVSVTYTRDPAPAYTFGAAASGGTLPPGNPSAALAAILEELIADGSVNLDSQAALYDGLNAADFVAALKAQGIDLAALGAVSWRYVADKNNSRLEWTTYDVSSLPEGASVPVIRLRPNGTFSVWDGKVVLKDTGRKDADGNPIIIKTIEPGATELPDSKNLTPEQKKDYDAIRDVYDDNVVKYQ